MVGVARPGQLCGRERVPRCARAAAPRGGPGRDARWRGGRGPRRGAWRARSVRPTAAMQRSGVAALTADQGLELFDRARAVARPLLVPVALGPPLCAPRRRPARCRRCCGGWSRRPRIAPAEAAARSRAGSAELPEADWDGAILELVRAQVAAVQGVESAAAVDPEQIVQRSGLRLAGRDRAAQPSHASVPGCRFPRR